MKNKEKYFKDNTNWFKNKATEKIDACLICRKPVEKEDNLYKNNNELAKCTFCSFVFRRYPPTTKVLNEFYNKSDPMEQWANIKQTKFEADRQRSKYSSIVDFVRKNDINSLLDFGCGNGFFLKMLPDSIKKIGLEPNIDAKEIAQKDIELLDNIDKLDQKVDMITLFGVLEHLKQPHEALLELKHYLHNDGHFAIIVPNVASLAVSTLKEKTSTFCPQHLWYFNIVTLDNVFKRHGFSLVKFETIEPETQPILRALQKQDPYDSSIVHKENGLEDHILKCDLGYKIIAIFKKNERRLI